MRVVTVSVSITVVESEAEKTEHPEYPTLTELRDLDEYDGTLMSEYALGEFLGACARV